MSGTITNLSELDAKIARLHALQDEWLGILQPWIDGESEPPTKQDWEKVRKIEAEMKSLRRETEDALLSWSPA